MADEEFRDPRLARLYDDLDLNRSDLDLYVSLVSELSARRVLDLGCGSGTLALRLAGLGCDVIGVDPAAASLTVARTKPGAGRVRWVDGAASAIDVHDRDLVTLTANAVQSIADPAAWTATLSACRRALQPGGHLVFETRRPETRSWEEWTPDRTRTTQTFGSETVTRWVEVLHVNGPLVTFQWTYAFASDGAVLTSTSTLRFRTRDEVIKDLRQHGFTVLDIRDAPDRPGRELVFVARRP